MVIRAGGRLGSYEVLGPLGAGGMGEVWRARDARLGREVAIKVLPPEVAKDESRLRRFEKEARSASALNHPNIVTIYEIGETEAVHWIAMERVDGRTVRETLHGGALPVRKLLPIAAQVADGLARAHEAGIVHRDLKPENVMVTKDGLVKILDFGLAKLTATGSGSDEGSQLPTETGTSPGVVLGTVGYMSPEQAGAQAVDFRSDQFSFGSILYELATGKRAFQKKTAVDTLSAILHEEPKPIGEVNPEAPTPLRWIVERCLAKEPERRYAATRDLARDLELARDRSSEAAALAGGAVRSPRRTAVRLALGALLLAAAAVFGARALWKPAPPAPPRFQRLTFRRGYLIEARFTPDGQTVVYSAWWDGQSPEVFQARLDSPLSRSLLADASLMSVSGGGELAIATGRPPVFWWTLPGTLATVPIAGGTPREVATDVQWADWAPDGKRIAVIRANNLEFPIGKVIYRGAAWFPRISPSGDLIAFGKEGRVHVVDSSGREVFVSRKFGGNMRVAWTPTGDEIWVSQQGPGSGVVYALNLSGKERVVLRIPVDIAVLDIARDGRVLAWVGNNRWETWVRPAGQPSEREMTILAKSDAYGLSPDGKSVLINDSGSFYLRGSDGSPPKRLGEGDALWLSSDGKWAIVVRDGPPVHLGLVPTGAGEERALENGVIEDFVRGQPIQLSEDGRRLLYLAHEKGHTDRLYLQDVAGGTPRPLTPEGVEVMTRAISPDGRLAMVEQPDGFWLYDVESGNRRLLAGMLKTDYGGNFSDDGRFLYAWNPAELPFRVFRVELSTGRREPWTTVTPKDPAGLGEADLMLTPDGKSYAYNCKRLLADLYVVEGLR